MFNWLLFHPVYFHLGRCSSHLQMLYLNLWEKKQKNFSFSTFLYKAVIVNHMILVEVIPEKYRTI